MVDIEQGSLSPFEEQVRAVFDGLVQGTRAAADVFFDLFCVAGIFVEDLVLVESGLTEKLLQQEIFLRQDLFELAAEDLGLDQVTHADAATTDLVFIGGADTASGGADFAVSVLLPGQVNRLVPGHDDMQIAVNHQLRVVLHVTPFL